MQGCLLPPFQAELDKSLGEDTLKAAQAEKKCEYRLSLDQPSSQYTVTKYKDNFVGNEQAYTFPLGATLSSYLSQAQNGDGGDRITLQFNTSNFHFVLGKEFIAAVNWVNFKAHFNGPKPIGAISFPISYALTPDMAEKIDFPEKTFYAVSQALRVTTIKLFDEVSSRMCYR
ncbi:MAG: hypothetical protein R3351_10135 [Nitrospirales bacterium]|nr:hypothetical protein [Nitrospirales bacterium]